MFTWRHGLRDSELPVLNNVWPALQMDFGFSEILIFIISLILACVSILSMTPWTQKTYKRTRNLPLFEKKVYFGWKFYSGRTSMSESIDDYSTGRSQDLGFNQLVIIWTVPWFELVLVIFMYVYSCIYGLFWHHDVEFEICCTIHPQMTSEWLPVDLLFLN